MKDMWGYKENEKLLITFFNEERFKILHFDTFYTSDETELNIYENSVNKGEWSIDKGEEPKIYINGNNTYIYSTDRCILTLISTTTTRFPSSTTTPDTSNITMALAENSRHSGGRNATISKSSLVKICMILQFLFLFFVAFD